MTGEAAILLLSAAALWLAAASLAVLATSPSHRRSKNFDFHMGLITLRWG